ncbi:chromosome segregation protein SMC [Loigolactobacillus backii]|uniref:Chromosome partition protein Smc n=1 Tax=Loigolactobacillus backii TaxID=375175 RepID=A0A192H3T6_9LACO|nr:chromosome segregation protein SMC [Loigolactobacillus backii]ANK63035.1 chromosome segregation protein SMC [Loigolactobacillus backii]ANK69957.1 chromosome segregation protein SMC [Loigolactobacillus backii]
MQLKTLEINGFKSFADKTVINFNSGITGIVGPNGSGKSNITEAIRWALGEQSAKSLRGGKMPDVIFAGSSARKPLNRAEVTLTFSNHDHALKTSFEEVSVMRSLYRDGTSAFYINQKPCRLKDIVNLFMDSGLGRESFSIISQGKIAAVFNSKPEDRRGIIEEAAGVVKYKQRKHEATGQLDETAVNLNRVADIIVELKDQVEPLKEQSSLAKDYLAQKKQLDEVTKTLLVRQIDEQVVAKKQQQTELKETRENLEQAKQNQAAFAQQVTTQKQQQQQLELELDQLQQQRLTLTKQQADVSGQQQLAGERRKVVQEKVANLMTTITTKQQQLSEQTDLVARNTQLLTEKQQQVAQQEKQLDLQQDGSLSASKRKQQIENLRNQYIDQMQQQTTLHNEAAYLQKQLTQENAVNKKQQNQSSAAQQRAAKVVAELDAAQKAFEQANEREQTLTKQLTDLTQLHQRHNQQYDQAQKNWYQALAIMQKAEAKQSSFAEMKQDYAGFYAGVRGVLKNRRQLNGIVGAVAELVEVPEKYNTAIETALGGQLQSVVVENQSAGKAAIQFLKQKQLGRATFLPLDVVHAAGLTQAQLTEVRQVTGFVGIAADLVTYDQRIAPVIRHLLGRIVIAKDITAAIQIANQLQHRIRVVSLSGDVMNPGGSMTGGGATKRGGLLARELEQRQLAEKLHAMQLQLDDKETALKTAKATLKKEEAQQVTLRQQQQTLTKQNTTAATTIATLKTQQAQFTQQQQASLYEKQQQAVTKKQVEQQLATNTTKTTALVTAMATLDKQLQQAQTDLTAYEANQNQTAKQRQAAQTSLAVAKEQLQHLKKEQREGQARKEDFASDLRTAQQEKEQLTKQLAQTGTTTDSVKAKLAKIEQQLGQQTTAITAKQQKRATIATALEQQQLQLDHAQAVVQQQDAKLTQVTANVADLNQQINHALTTLSETYELSYAAAEAAALSTATAELRQQAKLLQMGLDDIGTVNLGAISEYERLKKRYDFLNEQRQDLLTAKEQLTTTMTEMDQEVIQRFKTTFDQVAAAFSETFPKMFGGGQASLALTDPHELLTTGIEIIAQPPGKKLQQLSLLSGGERALTAITLLFAIIKVRPVPLCILDEVEAALDDANVDRFGRFLQHYDKNTQFVVITHRKGTMMAMDVLYGVAMQESGVSHMVSVSLKEATEVVQQ